MQVEGLAQVDTLTVRHAIGISSPTPVARYQYRDRLGSSTIETDEDGQVISYEEYYPYGASAYRAAASGVDLSLKRYRFTGKERDSETGLDYFGIRYYASWLGRWTSGDPGGFIDGLNMYRYTRNNPVNGVDNLGYSTEGPGDPPKKGEPINPIDSGEEIVVTASAIYNEPIGNNTTSNWGLVRAVGGLIQAVAGLAGLVAPEPTGVTKVLGTIALAHGIDDFQTGIRQWWTGRVQESGTEIIAEEGAKALGADEQTAKYIKKGVDIGASFVSPTPGLSIGGKGGQLALAGGGVVSHADEMAKAGAVSAEVAVAATSKSEGIMYNKDNNNGESKESKYTPENSSLDALNKKLAFDEKASLFNDKGIPAQEVLDNAKIAIEGEKLQNQKLIAALTKDGSNIKDWNKMSYVHRFEIDGIKKSFDIHFYKHSSGKVFIRYDYKSKLSKAYYNQTAPVYKHISPTSKSK